MGSGVTLAVSAMLILTCFARVRFGIRLALPALWAGFACAVCGVQRLRSFAAVLLCRQELLRLQRRRRFIARMSVLRPSAAAL